MNSWKVELRISKSITVSIKSCSCVQQCKEYLIANSSVRPVFLID
jgi:hypothetical protein